MRESLAGAPAPVVAVSPFVDGRSVKGPSEHFCAWAGIETSAAGIARAYADVIDAVVADEPVPALPHLVVDTLMEGTDRMRQLARNILEFGRTLDG
jgi:LPPG:FO 2-phospho-L-lactate transferase